MYTKKIEELKTKKLMVSGELKDMQSALQTWEEDAPDIMEMVGHLID